MGTTKRILITPGEPAGIGPDVTLHAIQKPWPVELAAIADPDLLAHRARQIGLPLQLIECRLGQPAEPHQPGTLRIIPIKLDTKAEPGKLNPANAGYVIHTLEKAAMLCTQKDAAALVTGPVQKSVINQAGIAFTGHTEFFAKYCRVPHTVMLFVIGQMATVPAEEAQVTWGNFSDRAAQGCAARSQEAFLSEKLPRATCASSAGIPAQMKVALVTTHLPLADVPQAITKDRLRSVLSILHDELRQKFHIHSPRLLVCGLNPHAGEGGYLGREEIEVITPVLDELRQQHYQIEGPLPADTIFTPHHLHRADAVLAMYHDQALPLVKYLGFGQAVNVTLGLPFIRTSVDHGTALDVAGTKTVDPGSMEAAIALAVELQCSR